jgi:hypothetical protein
MAVAFVQAPEEPRVVGYLEDEAPTCRQQVGERAQDAFVLVDVLEHVQTHDRVGNVSMQIVGEVIQIHQLIVNVSHGAEPVA